MSDNIISSYLVSLGFSVQPQELRQFQDALKEAGDSVERVTGGVVKQVVGWQTAIVGAFAAIGAGILGLADRMAEQDQSFRLFGLRMMMSTERAKSLKIAMDALGQPLEVIAWDPEIHGRFLQLIEDQKQLQAGLGSGKDFETQMRTIRDVRFEFTRLRVELQYLGMSLISNLFKAFGTDIDTVLGRLREWNNWIIENLPRIGSQVAQYLLPILKDVASVAADAWSIVKDLLLEFTNIVGLLSGDTSIESAALKFDNLAKAIQHVTHALAELFHWFIGAERVMAKFGGGMASILSGDEKSGKTQLQAGGDAFNAGSGAVLGAGVGTLVAPGLGTLVGGGIGAALGALVRALGPTPQGDNEQQANADGARGIRNNNPGNINFVGQAGATKEGGPGGRFAVFQSAGDGLTALAMLLRKYGAQGNDTVSGIISKYAPPSDHNNTGSYIESVAKALGANPNAHLNMNDPQILSGLMNSIIRMENGKNPYSAEQIGGAAQKAASMQVGSVNVYVTNTGASPDQIGHAVQAKIREMQRTEYSRTLAQGAGY